MMSVGGLAKKAPVIPEPFDKYFILLLFLYRSSRGWCSLLWSGTAW